MGFYCRILEHHLLPAYYGLQGRAYGRHCRFLEQSQWWPAERLREFQWQELKPLLAVAFRHVPFYRQKYSAAGAHLEDIRSLEDFARLPAVTRDDIRQYRREMCSAAWRGKLMDKATGGSSGQPTHFYITLDSYDWRCAASARAYSWSGCHLGEPTLYLWGGPVGTVRRGETVKMRWFRRLRRELMINTFCQSEELWAEAYRRALRFRPRFVVGYVSSLEQFCRYLLARGLSVPGIRAALAAAEPVYEPTRKLVQQALGAPLYNTYGSREFMSIAAECERRCGLHINMENILVESASPAAGGPSKILITDLHNLGMPFLRYEIGDLGTLSGRACACGRGLALLESVDGRVLDLLRTASGRLVPGEFFPHLLKELPEVLEFQVEQKQLDRVVLSLVLSGELSEASRRLLLAETRNVFGNSTTVEVRRVESIPRLASGKQRVTIGLGHPN